LRDDAVPEVDGEGGVGPTEDGDKVIFEGSNGAFCGVASVDVRGNELEIYVFAVEEAAKEGGGFIVKALEDGSEPSADEEAVDGFVGGDNCGGLSVLHWFRDDGVAVIVVDD
jgi:hypothetical protein